MVRIAMLGLALLASAAAAQPATKPLSAILQTVEGTANRVVFSAESDRGRWEVVSCESRRDMICREDVIDASTGAVIRSEREAVLDLRPPTDAKPASAIARSIETAGLGEIRALEWDSRVWEARLRNSRGRAELDIDPVTGATRRCEGPGCRE